MNVGKIEEGCILLPVVADDKKKFTIEEYLEFDKESKERHEYYKGDIYVLQPARLPNNIIMVNLAMDVERKLRGKDCQPYFSKTKLHVPSQKLFTYAALIVVCGEPVYFNDDELHIINPSVIFEVISSFNGGYDGTDRFELYKDIPSLMEYIQVDAQKIFIESFNKNSSGDWSKTMYSSIKDILKVKTINSVLRVSDIYEDTGISNKIQKEDRIR